ncbi:uncharacterized protein F5891DRAFT_400293 [Suillus fuscotomentosus]|uniref:Uncharacterized protein n=1 Tax=Suillus fuscotomentosus TaxID=1912939 RepID=A0AAD4HK48_9AGAM|nr:uncharacterized protein F5891DRAFT_400293 [Suillus fuscotomentosus]KAG1899472.1 hypothetical protein F5891DRAFT_400293 [Suillus fuscotomentosus]
MRSFFTLSLILPSVLAVPFKFPTHHQHSSSCVIAGVAYPNPRHALVLLGKRELRPPTGLTERAFTDFLLLCHKSSGRSSSAPLLARQQGSYLSNALGDPAENDSMLDTTTPGGALPASGDQNASSFAATSPSTTPATTTSPATPSPSETHGSTTAGPTSTGTPAGSDSDAHGTSVNTAGSPPSGNTLATAPTDSEMPLAQSDSSAFDTPIPQGMTAGSSSPVMDSSVSDSFGDVSGGMSDAVDSFDDTPVNDTEGGEPVAMDAQGGV